MANLNWTGSVAQERVKMTSTGTVDTTITAVDPFLSATVYVPERFALETIVDWKLYEGLLTEKKPCLFTVNIDNYADIIKGGLLTQWSPVLEYAQFTMYVVVFKEGAFEIGDTTISCDTLTKAFNVTHHLGFNKYLYDPKYTGEDVVVSKSDGEKAKITVQLANNTNMGVKSSFTAAFTNKGITPTSLDKGTYMIDDGSKRYVFVVNENKTIAASNSEIVTGVAAGKGSDSTISVGMDVTSKLTGLVSGGGVVAKITEINQGTPTVVATKATRKIGFSTTGAVVTMLAGDYVVSDHTLNYKFTLDTDKTIAATPTTVEAIAETAGADAQFTPSVEAIDNTKIKLNGTTAIDTAIAASCIEAKNGVNADAGSSTEVKIRLINGGVSDVNVASLALSLVTTQQTYSFNTSTGSILEKNIGAQTVVEATEVGVDSVVEGYENLSIKAFVNDLKDAVDVFPTSINNGTERGAGASVTIPAGDYYYTANSSVASAKTYKISISTPATLDAGSASSPYQIGATEVGYDGVTATGTFSRLDLLPNLPVGIVLVISKVERGSDPVPSPTTKKSEYFDLSLALAQLCNTDGDGLSCHWCLVKTSFVDREPSYDDKCYLRVATRGEEQLAMTSLVSCDRKKYFWNALAGVMQVTKTNLCTVSEPNAFIFADVWINKFKATNASGTYIGNGISGIRMSGSRIKPYGYPSWVDSSINENDAEGHDLLNAKKIGYLMSISSSSEQDCILSSCASVSGLPMRMIEVLKYCDYTIRMHIADFLASKDRISAPLTLDNNGYSKIKSIIQAVINGFASDGMITDLQWNFPSLEAAKMTLSGSGIKGFALGNYCSGKFHENIGACSGTWDLTAV